MPTPVPLPRGIHAPMLDVRLRLDIRMLVVTFDRVRVDRRDGAFRELERCAEAYRAAGEARGSQAPGSVPGVEHARQLFQALGLDPTKRRPSSEALLNRALKSKPMPHVSNLVDVGNWVSLDLLLPLGLYDTDRVHGPIVLRRGTAGDGYDAINHAWIDLEGRYLLADDDGPFGSPMTDSLRTAVTESTTAAAVLVYAPLTYDSAELAKHSAVIVDRVETHCDGGEAEVELL